MNTDDDDVIGHATALVARPAAPAAPAVTWTPTFAVAVDEAIERKNQKHRFFESVMVEGVHYGVIPGTIKPTLLKPGAEMLLANMGLQASFADEEPPVVDVTGADHAGEPYIRHRRTCRIYRQLGTREDERMIVAQASGSCSSWEPKYRYRSASLACPQCGQSTIIRGKAEYGGGWLCYKKKGGCGAKFDDDDREITTQEVGKILNPNVAEVENTILKMADKRALVAATLIATGCSDIFTQDIEDAAQPQQTRPLDGPELMKRAVALGCIDDADRGKFLAWARAELPRCADIGTTLLRSHAIAIDAYLRSIE